NAQPSENSIVIDGLHEDRIGLDENHKTKQTFEQEATELREKCCPVRSVHSLASCSKMIHGMADRDFFVTVLSEIGFRHVHVVYSDELRPVPLAAFRRQCL